ncbi:hypothetical protein [Streptomyces spongiae]|uniref:Uncharacterized protein n=1 Tax=Streptomyces spongiae TaxID=565072 RepID=A0A5N8XPE4_9ACTN|nr:hypothetical protein [Streptomyces spongiae]MPY61289.1 hypothetical protein [Streptomyces spongiae]
MTGFTADWVIATLDGAEGENWRECADVLYCTLPCPPAEAWLLAGLVLRRYPGCVLALVPRVDGGCVVRVRGGLTAGAAAAATDGAGPVR